MASKTWNKYQNNYRRNHYKAIGALLDSDLVDKFKDKLKDNDIKIADFLRNVIEEYLRSNI